MKSLGFILEDNDHRAFYSLKFTFIRQGEVTISNNEVFKRLLDEYMKNHTDEIVEIPDFTYDNYIKKAQTAGSKRNATIRRKKRDSSEKE